MNGFKHWPLVMATGAIVSTLMLCTYSLNLTIAQAAPERWRVENVSTAVSDMRKNTEKMAASLATLEARVSGELDYIQQSRGIYGRQRE